MNAFLRRSGLASFVVLALTGWLLPLTSGCPSAGGGAGDGERPTCAAAGEACEGNADCCEDLDCTDGTCQEPADVGTIAGTVTNELTGLGVSGVAVAIDPAVEGEEIVTAEDGTYSVEVAPGDYSLTFEHDNFEAVTETVSVVAGETATVDVALTPVQAVVLTTNVEGDAEPGGTLTVTVAAEVLDGTTTIESYSWMQSNSVGVTIEGADTATATVTLPDTAAYKEELLMILAEPPISEEELPPNVPLPEGEFPGGLQDRFQIVGLNPFSLEETGLVTLEVTVTTTSGEFTEEVEIHTELPWKPSLGIRDVPVGIPVLLHGKTQEEYDWALTAEGSGATLTDAMSQDPYFTPDVSGLYTVMVTDNTADPAEEVALEIYAGTWEGVITGQDEDGRPLAANCTACHNGTVAADRFTPWAQTGHAEIFTDSLNTSTHYGENCFACHTVGFDTEADNGGIDEASDYQDFIDAGLINNPDDNWTTVLNDFPDTAQLANVQCENCHGPQNGGAHTTGAPRIDISSDVCAVCHGEPLRHGRFQQWQLSGHANYELAIEEGESGSCARCHTGNGFLAWLPVLLDDDPDTDPLEDIEVAWTADQTHPQTCVTCHDPHRVGTTTDVETDATVRIFGDTPPLIAGFTVTEAGNAAICMTCHNSRRGLRNDETFEDTKAEGDAARAPHGSAQTDVLMGQNAYFVAVGTPGSHATVEDTCVNCHMEQTPPPDLLAYEGGGTNHTFFANADICFDCHDFGAEVVQDAFDEESAQLQSLIEKALLQLITEQVRAGNTIGLIENDETVATISDASEIAELEFGESHGRQAITVTLADDTTLGPFRMNDVIVQDESAEALGELYDFADDRLIKAGWNWNLVNTDGSRGVHNPVFVPQVLDAAIDALEALAAG